MIIIFFILDLLSNLGCHFTFLYHNIYGGYLIMKRLLIIIFAFIGAIFISVYEYREYYEDSYEVSNITKTIKDPLPSLPIFED